MTKILTGPAALYLMIAATLNVAHARVTAVIFDCDGVLVETESLKYEAWREALLPTGIKLTRDEYVPLIGSSNQKVLGALAERHHVKLGESIITAKEAAYKRRQTAGVSRIDRDVALVRQLRARQKVSKIKLGLASGGMKSEILENLRQTGLSQSFDQILSAADDLGEIKDPTGTNKPKPYVYQKMARLLGVDPADVIVFEDSGAGVEAAASAGMTVYAVPNAMTKGQDFSRAKAILGSGEEVPGAFLKCVESPTARPADCVVSPEKF